MGILNRAPAPIDTDRPAAADFVRVLATWAVGAFHIWQQSWYGGAAPAHWLRAGSVGVDLLVMLSAFCLFLPWANAAVRDQPLPRIRPAEFYRRRALRLLASLCAKWPLPTLAALGLVQLGYTCWLLPQYGSGDYSARFNQLPAFSGVLAVGLAAAWVFAKFAHGGWAQHVLPRAGCTALGLAALIWLDAEMRAQAAAAEYQQFQLINRMPLVLAAAAVLVCFGLGLTLPEVLRRALRWLAALTYSFYLWHQMLTVFLKYDLHLPAWAGDTPPNQFGDAAWMHRADLLYWAAALAVSAAAYYLIEKPAANFIATHKTVSQPRM